MKRWLVALAFLLGSIPSPALAHSSDYCGHGSSGSWNHVHYKSSYTVTDTHNGVTKKRHHHRYEHWTGPWFDHWDLNKHCALHSAAH